MPKVKGNRAGTLISKFVGEAFKEKKGGQTAQVTQKTQEKGKNLVLISVIGNHYCLGNYLQATLTEVTNAKHFGFTTFLMVDDPQENNLLADYEAEIQKNAANASEVLADFLLQARKLGDDWWKQNESIFFALVFHNEPEKLADLSVDERIHLFNQLAQQHNIPCEVIRWQEWMKRTNIDKAEFEKLHLIYENENLLNESVECTIKEFEQRKSKKASPKFSQHDKKIAKHHAEFIIVESIGVIIGGSRLGYHYLSYAGVINAAFKASLSHFNISKNLLQYLHINFKYISQNQTKEIQEKNKKVSYFFAPTTKVSEKIASPFPFGSITVFENKPQEKFTKNNTEKEEIDIAFQIKLVEFSLKSLKRTLDNLSPIELAKYTEDFKKIAISFREEIEPKILLNNTTEEGSPRLL